MGSSADAERLSRRLGHAIEAGLLATVAASVLWLGGVTTDGRLAAELGVATVLLLTAIREWLAPERPGRKLALRAAAPLVLLALLALAQTLPVSGRVMENLASGRARFEAEIRPDGETAGSTAFLSIDPASTRSEAIWLIAVAAFLFVALRAAADRQACRRLTFGLAAIAGVVALVGMAQALVGNGKILWTVEPPANSKPFGPYVNRNHFAGLMEIGLGAGLAYFVVEVMRFAETTATSSVRARLASLGDRTTAPLVLSALFVLVMGAATLFSQSRAGMAGVAFIGVVASCACLLTARSGENLSASRKRAALSLLVAGGIVATALVLWIGPAHVLERFGDVPSENARIGVWSDCLRLAWQSPVFGTGIGTFASVYPAYQTVPVTLHFAHAESDWWQLLVEGGAVALFVVALGLPVLLGAIRKCWAKARWSARTRILCLGAGVTAIILHGFVDINLHLPANALAFSLVVALLLCEATSGDEPRRASI